ncbi:UNKNOWN [Stylonychia lemnae]|uniref:Uncharacterized protein n=1 Tax=Stylonychia lemnae TaxID=5949 RepID=A0A077ZVS7_STYLE|nr:UNKNOWN [Stylonychia lemnae]|eukprot:CDW72541.1 UNKNOWN [Stylonychia lemnae]
MSETQDDQIAQSSSNLDKNLEEEKSDKFNIASQPLQQNNGSSDAFLEKSSFKGIFSLKSKSQIAKERFNQKAQDYLESHKMSIYLQDAIKIILDRREDKPLDLLNEQKCFLQQVKKVFHSTPFYKVITALDYHQMLCLVCSDFPRALMIDTVKTLPIAGATSFDQISSKQGVKYQSFVINASYSKTYCLNNMILTNYKRLLPPIEAILEVLITKTKAEDKLKDEPLILSTDAGMIRSRTLINDLYEPVFNKRIFQVYDQLKEIASEQTSASVKEQIKRAKTKKKGAK